ncbi:MAG: glycoside hydrolase family 5 protein [Ruminococcus sp.]|nr:glycoside hydrolase family 5 protein [Ruminococcus sp.]
MRKTRLLALLAALTVSVTAFVSCGSDDSSSGAETTTTAAGTQAPAESTADSKAEPDASLARTGEIRSLTAAQLVAEIKTGWNLGNSLDAYGNKGVLSEIAWGNPKTTKDMIDAVKAKGFDLIRIPVTWGGHLGEGPDYTVDPEWFDRVQEVVNYAYDNGMYVIINSHHEEDWRIPDNKHIEAVDAEVKALWLQIAERFKDYGDHLIFEGLNEPRVKDGANEWNGGTKEGRECVNRLNKTFLDAVRSTGGNNTNRLLLLTTFASSCGTTAINAAEIPQDEHVGYSIHAYTPYAFTYNANESWELFTWDGSHDTEILGMLYNLKERFVDNGVPVIITEYGAVNKDGNDEEVAKWATCYLTTAKSVGIPCVWWDNGYYTTGNELFGIFNRKKCEWYSNTVADAIVGVYK